MLSYWTFPVRQPDYNMWTCLQVLRGMDSIQFSMTSHHLHSCLSLYKLLFTCVGGGISAGTCLRVSAGSLLTAGIFFKVSDTLYYFFFCHLDLSLSIKMSRLAYHELRSGERLMFWGTLTFITFTPKCLLSRLCVFMVMFQSSGGVGSFILFWFLLGSFQICFIWVKLRFSRASMASNSKRLIQICQKLKVW